MAPPSQTVSYRMVFWMQWKQKQLPQVVEVELAALIFLPNVGLQSLYWELQLDAGGSGERGRETGGDSGSGVW